MVETGLEKLIGTESIDSRQEMGGLSLLTEISGKEK
jgi:hypothetical protein